MTYPIKIVTPNGIAYDEKAEKLIIRTISGDVGILENHIDYTVPIKEGKISVITEHNIKSGYCLSGILNVSSGCATVITKKFKWDG